MPLRPLRAWLMPGWARLILQNQETIMSQIEDLKAVDAANATAVSSVLAELKTLAEQHNADLAALAQKPAVTDDPDLRAIIDGIQARNATMNSTIAALQGTVAPPATDPAPQPAAA